MPNETFIEFNSKFKELASNNPNYSIGEILFSIIQPKAVTNNTSMSFLLNTTDEDLVEMVIAAQIKESK